MRGQHVRAGRAEGQGGTYGEGALDVRDAVDESGDDVHGAGAEVGGREDDDEDGEGSNSHPFRSKEGVADDGFDGSKEGEGHGGDLRNHLLPHLKRAPNGGDLFHEN